MINKKSKTKTGRLYVSFNGQNTDFKIGSKFKYIIDAKSNKIFIVPAKEGMTVSRKKTKTKDLSLIDLRSKTVKNNLKKSDYLNIIINKNKIVVEAHLKSITKYEINRSELQNVVGLDFSSLKVDTSYSGYKFYSQEEETQFKKDIIDSIKVASLFSGAGMLDYPFKIDKSFEVVFANELDENASISYINNIGDHLVQGSIKDISKLPNDIQIIIGGPPCKPFSNQNRNLNCRLDNHPDSDLMLEYIRLVNTSNADVFVMENVPQILTACDGKYIKAIEDTIDPSYELTKVILKDCDYGGFTTRKRAFIFGSKIGKVYIPKPYFNKSSYKTVGEALSKVKDTWYNFKDIIKSSKDTLERISYINPGSNYIESVYKIPERLRIKAKMSNAYRKLSLDKPSCTIINYMKSVISHPVENRIISVAEALAISGFDSNFRIFGNSSTRHQQVGNGVPFALGNLIKDVVLKLFKKY